MTWTVDVPRGGDAEIMWQTRIGFPEGMTVLR